MRYPLELALRPSRRLQVMIAAIHGIAAVAFLHSGQPSALIAVVLFALLFSAALLVRIERSRGALLIVLEDSGLLTLRSGGRIAAAVPLPGSTDFGWAVWLHWQELSADTAPGRRKGALMLLPDHVAATTWRPLRIWLRHKGGGALGAPASRPERT